MAVGNRGGVHTSTGSLRITHRCPGAAGKSSGWVTVVVAGAGIAESLVGLLTGCHMTNEDWAIGIICLYHQLTVRGWWCIAASHPHEP